MGRAFPPGGLFARVALVLLVALVLQFTGAWAINAWQRRELIADEQLRLMAAHLATAERVVRDSAHNDRDRLMGELDSTYLQLGWAATTDLPPADPAQAARSDTYQTLIAAQPSLAGRDLRLQGRDLEQNGRELRGALRLADGSFLTFRARALFGTAPPVALLLGLHLSLVVLVMAAALAWVRAIVKPLRNLAATADATGAPAPAQFTPEGPREVRQLAVALSAMQARLLRVIEDHTESLVAVSHDLRTPIQRLQLRAALTSDEELRDALAADLAEIERFISSVIGYMSRGETESRRLVDVAALAMTAADDAADTGAAVEYRGPDVLTAQTKPLALKRALNNLVENACKHAQSVVIDLSQDGGEIVLRVEDDGPGVPAERRKEAFMPFRRLDGGRAGPASAKAGAGLGLAIVRNAMSDLGGRASLGDSALGGLAAELRFPSGA